MIFLTVALAVVASALAAYVWHSSTRGLLSERRRQKVLVTLKSGEAFSGVMFSVDRDAMVLREVLAVAYGPRSEDVPVGGEVLILRADVAYLQVP